MVVRVFARHLAVLDPATEVPPVDLLPHHYRRITPHLYTPVEITALLHATDALQPALRALAWRTLISLLAVTGLSRSPQPTLAHLHCHEAKSGVGDRVRPGRIAGPYARSLAPVCAAGHRARPGVIRGGHVEEVDV